MIDRLMRGGWGDVEFTQARCLRMRFGGSDCSRCKDACPRGAIKFEAGLTLKDAACTGCMLCTALCPQEALLPTGFDFTAMLAELKRAEPEAVLGCRRSDVSAHENAPCLGMLSEEHLIALFVFTRGTVALNLTQCGGCASAFVPPFLKERIAAVGRSTGLDVRRKFLLIETPGTLRFKEPPCGRRGFLSSIGMSSVRETAQVLRGLRSGRDSTISFAKKTVPERRVLLGRIMAALTGVEGGASLRAALLEHYYFSVSVGEHCNLCYSCVGACPTGAICIERDRPETGVMVNPSICTGCGLCVSFCLVRTMAVTRGLRGEGPFGFRAVGPAAGCEAPRNPV